MSASIHDFMPPMPDLGTPSAIPNSEDPEGYLLNIAMIVRIARHEPTPKSAAFYRAFCRNWDRIKHGSGSINDRQASALRRAFDEVNYCGPMNRGLS